MKTPWQPEDTGNFELEDGNTWWVGECPILESNVLLSDSTVIARETAEGFSTYRVTLQDLVGNLNS